MQSTVTSQMTAMTATMGAQAGALRAEMNTGAAELRASIAEDSYGTRALDFLQPATTRMLKLQGGCVVRGLARLTARAPRGHTGRFWHGAGVTPWPLGGSIDVAEALDRIEHRLIPGVINQAQFQAYNATLLAMATNSAEMNALTATVK